MEEIKIKNLTFKYPQSSSAALCDVNLTIAPGELVLVCGKSGCGKSTLLRLLKPLIAPHGEMSGAVMFADNNIADLPEREQAERIGFVMQNPQMQIVCDKVWHELAFGLESLGVKTEEIRARVAEMAAFFGIQDWFYKDTNELSGGQKQLLNLAAVMVMQPQLLILDEPTSQLDPIAAREFLQTVCRINNELGTTVIISEHRLEEIYPQADRVLVLEKGKVVAFDEPKGAARQLWREHNEMFEALPTPARVYFAAQDGEKCPVTVREGREWLGTVQHLQRLEKPEPAEKKGSAVIRGKDIWFRYDKNGDDVLKGLSFEIYGGEIYAIMGSNGAGKSTALSVICGINKPYRGKVEIAENKRLCALPQEAQTMFSHQTVIEELLQIEDNREEIEKTVNLCRIGDILDRHPYDISGGEQQRAALAAVLLSKPDILILDEPTKGLDSAFKLTFAKILSELKQRGITVLMVSHDIEFCAKYADRAGMFFDGRIISCDSAKRFFLGKSFYTTAACRMSRGIIENAVTEEDILAALGKSAPQRNIPDEKTQPIHFEQKEIKKSEINLPLGILFAAIFVICSIMAYKTQKILFEVPAALAAMFSAVSFLPQRRINIRQIKRKKKDITGYRIAAALIMMVLVPATVIFGVWFLNDRRYYFITLCVVCETLAAFMLDFEGSKPRTREIIIVCVLCALAVAGREAFAMLPHFKPVAAVVIIAGIGLGAKDGFLVGAMAAFLSNFFFGQGPWTPWQMFSFGILGLMAGLIFEKVRITRINICIFGFLSVLVVYGLIMDTAAVAMRQTDINSGALLAAYALGFPLNTIHAMSTGIFLWIAAPAMLEKIERIKIKYGF